MADIIQRVKRIIAGKSSGCRFALVEMIFGGGDLKVNEVQVSLKEGSVVLELEVLIKEKIAKMFVDE